MYRIQNVASLLVFFQLISCGGDSAQERRNAMTGTSSTLIAVINTLNKIKPTGTSLALERANRINLANTYGADWATNQVLDDLSTSSLADQLTVKNWIVQQLSELSLEETAVSYFAKFQVAISSFCAVGVGLRSIEDIIDTSTGYPKNGTHDFTISNELVTTLKNECKYDATDDVDQTLNVTVSDSSGEYVKSVQVVLGDHTNHYLIKYVPSSSIKIASFKNKDSMIIRSVTEYNVSTGVIRSEYLEGPTGADLSTKDLLIHRLYYNEKLDEAYLLGFRHHEAGVNDDYFRYVLTSKPDESTPIFSLSMRSSYLADTTQKEACVSSDTGDLQTDGQLCSTTDSNISGLSIDNAASLLDGIVSSYNGLEQFGEVNSASALNFNQSNFLSASLSSI